jgi:hypothetical protein
MRPIPVQKPRFEQPRAVMMLDDAEMALELIDLAQTTTLRDSRRAPAPPFEPSADLLTELCNAACMIMDREECAAMLRELELERLERQSHPVAA